MGLYIFTIIVTSQQEIDNLPDDFDGTIIIDAPDAIIEVGDALNCSITAFTKVRVSGGATVIARLYAHITACDESCIIAYDRAYLILYNKSRVIAHDSVVVEVYGREAILLF